MTEPPLSTLVRFDLTTVRLFQAVARHGSISRAAELHFMATAAASRRIAALEAQFGLPLFERRPHGVALTEAGRAILAHANLLMQVVDRMRNDADAHLRGDRGVVRIAACKSAVMQFLPADLQALARSHPGIRIDLQEMTSGQVIGAVHDQLVNIGVYEEGIGAVSVPSRPYRSDRLLLVVPAGHVLAQHGSVRLVDLLAWDFIGLAEGSSIAATLEHHAARHGAALRIRVRTGSFDSLLAMVLGGIGIGLVPDGVAAMFAVGDALRLVALDEPWAVRRFRVCREPEDGVAPIVEAIYQALAPDAAS